MRLATRLGEIYSTVIIVIPPLLNKLLGDPWQQTQQTGRRYVCPPSLAYRGGSPGLGRGGGGGGLVHNHTHVVALCLGTWVIEAIHVHAVYYDKADCIYTKITSDTYSPYFSIQIRYTY